MYGCRFVHSMIDNQSEIPVHLDGAIRAYTEEKMLLRLEQKISETARDTEYTKLWRIDGNIPPSLWKELITHYYRDNKLIGEYFNGKDEQEIKKPAMIINEEISPVKKCVPYSLDEGDGLRFSIRYKQKEVSSSKYDVLVRVNHELIKPGIRFKYINTETTTLLKLLRQKGINVREPLDSVRRIIFNDTVINFPVLLCRGEAAIKNANIILDCIKSLCDAWIRNGNNTILSFSVEIEYESLNILYSYAGHVNDVVTWIKDKNSHFPTSINHIDTWCESFAKFLNSYPVSDNQPETFELLNEYGVLNFERVFIESERIENTEVDEEGLLATIAISKKDKALYEALLRNDLSVTAALHAKHSICSNCDKEYRDCGCIKMINDIYETPKDIDVVGYFWTNRKAQ